MTANVKRSRVRRLMIKGSMVFVMGVISIAVCEASLRLLNIFPDSWPPEFQKYHKALVDAYIYANDHGYYEPHSVIPVHADGAMVFGTVDELGYIGTRVRKPLQNDLLVFGDSFAYGFGVRSDRSFAALLHAYNAGVWGQPFPFHCRVFDRVLPMVRPKRAVWVIYPPHLITCTPRGWNTRRTIDPLQHPRYAFLIEQFNKTKLSTLILKTLAWGINRTDYYSLEWSLYDAGDRLADEGYASFESSVIEILKTAKQGQVQVIPLFVPSKTQVALELSNARPLLYPRSPLNANLSMDRMAKILETHGISRDHQINLMEMMRQVPGNWRSYYFKTDAHINEAGSAAVAAFLEKRLNDIPLAEGN